ncbi:MAG: DUF4433 domain-containing protein [Methanoregula sp.]|nr:DUF4433 domain-containing protein [Methanoregula sp.]MDD5189025.1 DUF4433 domain-containing protein [Methanoregula sp.]
MPIDPSHNKKIHHITHYSNLSKIIHSDRMLSSNELSRLRATPTNIGHTSLKYRRSLHSVPISPNGTLNDYVPFFLGSRPPMIIAIAKGSVTDYHGTQREIIYIVSSTQKIVDAGCTWCFTDGHAVEAMTEYYNDLQSLEELDWDAIGAFDFRPTADDPDKYRKKQAEFLVHGNVPWRCVESITVKDGEMRTIVERILNETNSHHRPTININRNWYYNPRSPQ